MYCLDCTSESTASGMVIALWCSDEKQQRDRCPKIRKENEP